MGKNDLLSFGSIVDPKKEYGGRHIVCLSGGVASAWVANWVKNNIDGEIVYYFNDTKWEHPDLYRFLDDLEKVLKIEVTKDNNGKSPEDIFYDKKILGSNRSPVCSKFLKAEMLQKFVKKNDILYFGIDLSEIHRAARITPIYARLECECKFPLIDHRVLRHETFNFIESIGIEIPQMYKDGFTHNNCSGGCVRSGERQWVSLLNKYPEVYADRERIEAEFTIWNNKRRIEKDRDKIENGIKIKKPYKPRDYHFLKDISLKDLREKIQQGIDFEFGEDEWQGECIGVCGKMY